MYSDPKSPARVALVLGNWKMHGTRARIDALLSALLAGDPVARPGVLELGVCPPFPYLEQVARALQGRGLSWGGQHVSVYGEGAYTGEVSASMLADLGCTWVLVGHSERRSLFADTDDRIAVRVQQALAAQLRPVVCVGESEAEHAAGQTQAVLARQLDAVVPVLQQGGTQCVIAYEPVWAIGTGRSATAEQAQAVHQFIRAHVRASIGDGADALRIVYGGSVKAANAAALLAQPDVDGALVGGASWLADEFLAIAQAAVAKV